MAAPVLEVKNLSVDYVVGAGTLRISTPRDGATSAPP